MKAKATWKPIGLRAKRWREAGHSKAPADLLPPAAPPKEKVAQKQGAPQSDSSPVNRGTQVNR